MHGLYSHGFSNCFHLGILQNTLTPNFPHMLDEQVRHIADIIQHAKLTGAQVIEPTAEAEAGWLQTLRDTPSPAENFCSECTAGLLQRQRQARERRNFPRNLRGGPGGVP